jgi:indole-3-glycerol phosphate synthase
LSDFLDAMRRRSLERADGAEGSRPALERMAAVVPEPRRPALGQFGLIAEIKRVSPAAGVLPDSLDPDDRARRYAEGGAVALSVLTEDSKFGGSLDDLSRVAAAVELPVMRKDFLVDPIQLLEARARGASGVLLIAEILDEPMLDRMLDVAAGLGLWVLLESFSVGQLRRVMPRCDGEMVLCGVNCRDLRDLSIDLKRFDAVAPILAGQVWVAESGMNAPSDVARVARIGCRLALCGTALMRAADPESTVREFTERGRGEQCG